MAARREGPAAVPAAVPARFAFGAPLALYLASAIDDREIAGFAEKVSECGELVLGGRNAVTFAAELQLVGAVAYYLLALGSAAQATPGQDFAGLQLVEPVGPTTAAAAATLEDLLKQLLSPPAPAYFRRLTASTAARVALVVAVLPYLQRRRADIWAALHDVFSALVADENEDEEEGEEGEGEDGEEDTDDNHTGQEGTLDDAHPASTMLALPRRLAGAVSRVWTSSAPSPALRLQGLAQWLEAAHLGAFLQDGGRFFHLAYRLFGVRHRGTASSATPTRGGDRRVVPDARVRLVPHHHSHNLQLSSRFPPPPTQQMRIGALAWLVGLRLAIAAASAAAAVATQVWRGPPPPPGGTTWRPHRRQDRRRGGVGRGASAVVIDSSTTPGSTAVAAAAAAANSSSSRRCLSIPIYPYPGLFLSLPSPYLSLSRPLSRLLSILTQPLSVAVAQMSAVHGRGAAAGLRPVRPRLLLELPHGHRGQPRRHRLQQQQQRQRRRRRGGG